MSLRYNILEDLQNHKSIDGKEPRRRRPPRLSLAFRSQLLTIVSTSEAVVSAKRLLTASEIYNANWNKIKPNNATTEEILLVSTFYSSNNLRKVQVISSRSLHILIKKEKN
jgi:hypothetical protein